MASALKVRRTVQVGGRRFVVHEDFNLLQATVDSRISATKHQSRVLARFLRDTVIQRLAAGSGKRVVAVPTAEELRGGVKPFKHVALAESTKRSKAARGQDLRRLIATGEYIESIEVREVRRRAGIHFIVRVPKRRHRDSTLTLRQIAKIQEFGIPGKIPARPHWRPALNALLRQFRKAPEGIRVKALRNLFNKLAKAPRGRAGSP